MNITKLVVTLTVVCVISAVSLSFVYIKTLPEIKKNKEVRELKLKQEIINSAVKFLPVAELTQFLSVEEGYDDKDKSVGLLIKNKCSGYGGELEYLVGIDFDLEPKIIKIKILSHRETPGLGAKVTTEKFLNQYKSKIVSQIVLKKDNINGTIDAITGATITSRALTKSVHQLLDNALVRSYVKQKIVSEPIPINTPVIKKVLKKQTDVVNPVEEQKVFISSPTSH